MRFLHVFFGKPTEKEETEQIELIRKEQKELVNIHNN